MEFFGYIVTGMVAGVMAGLFGVGGGVIVVPALVFSFELQGLDSHIITHLAIGTSLACMIFTSISSTWTHNKKNNVDWPTLRYLAPALVIGSLLGVMTAISLAGSTLLSILGIGLVLVAINMFRKKIHGEPEGLFRPKPWVLALGGGAIGYISSIFGIGGGVITTPFLSKLGQNIRLCVGTAAACSVPISLMGATANIILGERINGLPEYSTGLVYWPAFAGIVIASVPCARLGALLAHKLPAEKLTRLFGCLLIIVGSKFIFS